MGVLSSHRTGGPDRGGKAPRLRTPEGCGGAVRRCWHHGRRLGGFRGAPGLWERTRPRPRVLASPLGDSEDISQGRGAASSRNHHPGPRQPSSRATAEEPGGWLPGWRCRGLQEQLCPLTVQHDRKKSHFLLFLMQL